MFVGADHDPALFALLEDYGRPFVLTWGVDPCAGTLASASTTAPPAIAMTRHVLAWGTGASRC